MSNPPNSSSPAGNTIDHFVQIATTSGPRELAEFAAGLTEANRKKLSKTAQNLMREARKRERANFGWPTHTGHMARLALLAVGPRSQACRQMDFSRTPANLPADSLRYTPGANDFEKAAVRILADRRPEWADDWLEHQLTGDWLLSPMPWESVRFLIREGVCRKPESPGYFQLLAHHGASMDFEQDPDVLEDAWKLFHHPTHVFERLTYSGKPDPVAWKENQGENWPQVFYYYAHQGVLDRGRLIDEVLGALWREFSPAERAGLMQFHDLLAPTDEELHRRQSTYIELLRNPAGPVVTFGLKVLKTLAKSETFDAVAAVQALPAVFDLPAKSQPRSALSFLTLLLRKHPNLKRAAVEVILRGLSHPESDVQARALQILDSWDADELPIDALREMRDAVSAVVRPRLDERLNAASPSSVQCGTDDAESGDEQRDVAECVADLRTRIAGISDDLNTVWKLDESLAALEAGHMLPPVDIDRSPGVLAGLNEVAPIQDVEELIDAVGRLMEAIDSPMEIERVLEGLNRLGQERPSDFDERTNALRQRIQEIESPSPSNVLSSLDFFFPSVLRVLEDWLGVKHETRTSRFGWHASRDTIPVHQLLDLRANLIRSRLRRQAQHEPLLSFPTHEHGWIDPRVFVDRLKQVTASGIEPHAFDFRSALLRLAPDYCEEAIREAADLPNPVGRIVRYALGDAVKPSQSDREWKADWLAAGRARSPYGRLGELEPLDLPNAANAVEPATFRVCLDRFIGDREKRQFLRYVKTEPFVEIEPVGKMTFTPAEYPVLVITQQLISMNDTGIIVGLPAWGEWWLASLWPSNTDPILVRAIEALLRRFDEPSSQLVPIASLIWPLLQSERAWSRTSMFALWLTFFSRDGDARAVAVDALVEGLLDGRAHPEPLAEVLVEIAGQDWIKLNRLADSLQQVTRISSWGSLVISELLDRLIASWNKPPRNAHHVLEIQLELLMELGSQLSAAAQEPLKNLTGSSKTAKLATQLLKLDGPAESVGLRRALLEGIDLRTSRAEQLQPLRACPASRTEAPP